MLSYQHIYHAGSFADVHKHAILSVLLDLMASKPRGMSYLETHSGRGMYDLDAPEAHKVGEFKDGIDRVLAEKIFPTSHPYMKALHFMQAKWGPAFYPGSPALAKYFLRDDKDKLHLMALHPQEFKHLRYHLDTPNVHIHHRHAYLGVNALSPPTPRRGLVLIDPSYENKEEYNNMAPFVEKLLRRWPQATIAIWYPMLPAGYHKPMVDALMSTDIKDKMCLEVFIHPAPERGLYGSGVIILQTPFGTTQPLEEVVKTLQTLYPV
mgnify:CR=1 FL=1